MMPEPNSRLTRLRAATQDSHARIETAPALVRLMAHDLTRNEYVIILQHFQAFYRHLEPVVAAELETLPDAAAMLDGSRPRRLAEDLAWFGAPALQPPAPSGPVGRAAALGALYVIEGSGLGGRIIGRHVSECLDVAPGAGGSFFCGLDAENARLRWRRLGVILDAPMLDDDSGETGTDADDVMIVSARETFEYFERCLRGIEVTAQSGDISARAMAL
jgi:heme oxygenase (biliverdin-IX-beta and delta-forming)